MTKELFTLGDLYVSDFIKGDEQPRGSKHEMKLIWDSKNHAARLEKAVPIHTMFGKYWYRSGINTTMVNELRGIVESITSVMKLKDGDVWLDIACNDGTLFKFVPKGIFKIGIDPCDDSFAAESRKVADVIVQDYFSKEAYRKTEHHHRKAKIITTIAMFYDLDDIDSFVQDIYEVLEDDGMWVIQLSYTPLMIEQLAFDNICHEHVYYHSMTSINEIARRNGLKIMDAQLNDVNGGSFRVYMMKDKGDVKKFGSAPYRDVCRMRVESLLAYEKTSGLGGPEVWKEFFTRIQELKEQTYNFIKHEKAKGKTVWGYGASTKGNTLLQYFNLDNTLIDGIAERSPYKFGHRTVGTNIPIYSEEEARKAKPDYMLVLPWHFINEFIVREKDYLDNGGKFIVPCPKFEIIGKQD
ncbi:MAG TPA: class I SAM-dependent methyltransferase [Alphaproteobacteria bacterium]|nr:class I SAM-dependent methyltransferase [Alphaproteobacteria bacterium]